MSTQQEEQHAEEIILSAAELMVLDYLKSLDRGERATFARMSTFTGLSMRVCQGCAESLRLKGIRIVSSKRREDLGTWLIGDNDDKAWEAYLKTRSKEAQTILSSIKKMQSEKGETT